MRSNPIRLRGRRFLGVHALASVHHHLVLLAHVARAVVVVARVVEIVATGEVVVVVVVVVAASVPIVQPVAIRGVHVVRVEAREVVRVLPRRPGVRPGPVRDRARAAPRRPRRPPGFPPVAPGGGRRVRGAKLRAQLVHLPLAREEHEDASRG